MKASLPIYENWNSNKHKLQKLFTWLTGYEIIFEGSRKDLRPQKLHPTLKEKTEQFI